MSYPTGGAQMSLQDQEHSENQCVCQYCDGTHSGQLRQSLNCQNGPYNPRVEEAGTLSQVVHGGVLLGFGIRNSCVRIFPSSCSMEIRLRIQRKGTKARQTRSPERSSGAVQKSRNTVRLEEAVVAPPLRSSSAVPPLLSFSSSSSSSY